MVVVEAFLLSLFEVVLDKLVATPLLDYARRIKVDTTVLQEWRNTLLHLQAVLRDAEQRQIREEAVKRWLDDLKALAYDIEDVVDEFEAEARQPSLVQGPQTSSSSKAYSVNANLVAVRKTLTIAVLLCWGFMPDHVLEENENFLQPLSEA